MKKTVTLLCCALILLTLGISAGRYSVLSVGAVVSGSSGHAALPPITTYAALSAQTSDVPVKININTASAQQLDELPGIGEAISRRIVEYRRQNGEFESLEELMAVSGIGESLFAKIKAYITLE